MKPRVLLVEDSPVIQAQLSESLAESFDVVGVSATAAEAAAWLQAHPGGWELIVIDIFLRQGHGFDVLRRCAPREPWQRTVMLSNYTREPARSSALRLGADAVFDKCLEMESFLAYCGEQARAHAQRLAAHGGLCAS